MNLDSIVAARIHPGIGIARVGDSDEYFVGPEVPFRTVQRAGGYRDAQGRLKRQAAMFRIYGYDSAGRVVSELTAANADIIWHVHVANKKAAWYDFDFALDLPEAAGHKSARRNSSIQGRGRDALIVDPGCATISGRKQRSAPLDKGSFLELQVYLGELHTDDEGRLVFLGGRGKSSSPEGYSLTTFANNPGWHDDVSDGPVRATVKINGRSVSVDSAWVVTGPPNYAPDIVSPQTMYDIMRDALANRLIAKPGRPSFRNEILPLLRQCVDAQWVNAGFLALFGWKSPYEFLREDFLLRLSAAPGRDDPYKELRRQIYYSFRDPAGPGFEPLKWPPLYGDAFGSFDIPPGPREGFTITPTLYRLLGQWADGNFDPDYAGASDEPMHLDDVLETDRPEMLDRAALHFCMGGPFHPGCEMTWPMRRSSMYRAAFRLRERAGEILNVDYGEYLTPEIALSFDGPLSASGPGDVTRWMAVPWQSDTDSCRSGYPGTPFPKDDFIPTFWPSRVPNHVLTEDQYRMAIDETQPLEKRLEAFYSRSYWLRNLSYSEPTIVQLEAMVQRFGELGIVERRERECGPDLPETMYVETLAPHAVGGPQPASYEAQAPLVPDEYADARFPRRNT